MNIKHKDNKAYRGQLVNRQRQYDYMEISGRYIEGGFSRPKPREAKEVENEQRDRR